MKKVLVNKLRTMCTEAFMQAGLSEQHAGMAVRVLLSAELQGIRSHGITRVPIYIKRIQKGLMNPSPNLEVTAPAPALRIVDGDDGPGPVVALKGIREGISVAEKTGICFVSCHHSNHFGPGAPYALEACRSGMITIGATNTFPSIPPSGSMTAKIGNNPIFIGFPRNNAPHFILDMALSVVAKGRIRLAADKGESIPEGWALGPDGKPTTDPLEAMKGIALPIGGHKGYGLALAVDLIAGVLGGAGFGSGVLSLYQQWEKPQNAGHFFLVLNPSFFMPSETLHEREEALINEVKECEPLDPKKPVLYPGEIEAANWDRQKKDGISIGEDQLSVLKKLAAGELIENKQKY